MAKMTLTKQIEELKQLLEQSRKDNTELVAKNKALREMQNGEFARTQLYIDMQKELDTTWSINKILKANSERQERKINKLEEALNIDQEQRILDLIKENKVLKDKVEFLMNKVEHQPQQVQQLKNERGAGRKPKLSEQDQELIKMYRIQGKTIRELALMFNCSLGTIHKLINEQ